MAPSGRSFFGSKAQPSIRSKISSPVALLSTTNQLAYNAPDLFPSAAATAATAGPIFVKPISNPTLTSNTSAPSIPSLPFIKSSGLSISTTLASPASDVEVPDLLHSNSSTPDSSTRGSTPTSAEPNHLSGYFTAAALDQEKRKSNENDTPSRSQSRAGKVGELLGRKRSESKMNGGGRSPGASFSGAARKPSLSGFREKKEESFAPAPFAQRPEVKRPAAPEGGMFAPAEFSSSGPKSNGLSAPKPATSGGLGRKNTVRARGSVDMFAPGMGIGLDKVAEKSSMSNIREEANKVEQKSRTPIADQELKERHERQAARVAELKAAERMAPLARQNTFDRAANAPLPARTNTFDKTNDPRAAARSKQNNFDRAHNESRGPLSKPSMPELRSQTRPSHDNLRQNPTVKPSLPDLRAGLRTMNRAPPQLPPGTSDRRPTTAENGSSSQARQIPSPRDAPSPRSPVKQRTVSPFDNVLAQVDEQLAEQLGPRLGGKTSDIRLNIDRTAERAADKIPVSPLSPRSPVARSAAGLVGRTDTSSGRLHTPAERDAKIEARGEMRPDYVFTAQEYIDDIQCFLETWVEEMKGETKVGKGVGLDKVVVEVMSGQAGGAWI